MPNYISKIQLPSNGVYDIRDAHAWDASENGSLQKQINDLADAVAGGVTFIVAWAGTSAPTVANIPAGVKVYYNGTEYTGTLAAASATAGAFYMVKSSTQAGINDFYDEYVVVTNGDTKSWEKIGDTQMSFSTDSVLGANTTFSGSVSVPQASETHKILSASASGTAVGANGTANAVTGYASPTTTTVYTNIQNTSKKLVTTTVPNVTGSTDVNVPNITGNTPVTIPNVTTAGTASTWDFQMGTGANSECLIISGANGTSTVLGTALTATNTTLGTANTASKVTLGTAKTVATGAVDNSGSGATVITNVQLDEAETVLTGLGTPSTSACLTGVKVTTQPTISLSVTDGNTPTSGKVLVTTGVTNSNVSKTVTVTAGTNDLVDALVEASS
jgi:hypothetical protein